MAVWSTSSVCSSKGAAITQVTLKERFQMCVVLPGHFYHFLFSTIYLISPNRRMR